MIGGEQYEKRNAHGEWLWKRRSVEKSKSRLFHLAWKSRKKRGIPTFHTASTTAGYSFLGGLTGADPDRRNWLPLSPALTRIGPNVLSNVGVGEPDRSPNLYRIETTLPHHPPNAGGGNVELPGHLRDCK